ncbi:hypothetical protein F5Y16DRAFT_391144 [Xylariaceae sp. FL0255]|nr:hypothetical protein F5Y16DRAFT_391144 [Xylariaceae sp. FL0255]
MAPLLPTLAAHARRFLSPHESSPANLFARDNSVSSSDTTNKVDPSDGVIDPHNINNTFVFVLFGLIGVAFILTGIWFFFWAKNGGFYFKKDDWDEYKSTVLRRKGPNGTLLSGATESTDLGGGSVYKDVDDGSTEYTGGLTQMTETRTNADTMSSLSGITAGASDIAGRERRRRAREKKEREHEKRKDKRNRSSRRKVGEDGILVDEEAEQDAKRNLRAYRSERPARVGGLNKESEGSEWDGSTNPESSTMSGSEVLLNNRQSTPTSTPTKSGSSAKYYTPQKEYDEKDFATAPSTMASSSHRDGKDKEKKKTGGGIRKVYSAADRTANRENERLRAEARRLAEKGRSAGASSSSAPSRNFSFQRADLRGGGSTIEEETSTMLSDSSSSAAGPAGDDRHRGRYLPPGNFAQESDIGDGSDLGTKSYRHVIPGLSSSSGTGTESLISGSQATDYAEEKRRKRGAQRYRRGE